jgi:ketosteroid isomerase-like protein
VRAHIEAQAAGDAERALSFVDPDFEMDMSRMEAIDESTIHGHAELVQHTRRYQGTFADFRFEARRLVDADDRVVGLIREAGRGKGSGIPAERLYALVYTLRAGQIVHIAFYPEDAEALEAAGLRE